MHRVALAAGVLLLAAWTAACGLDYHDGTTQPSTIVVGSGRFVSESRPVQAVDRIVIGAGLRAIVTVSGAASLDITAEDNILPLIDAVEHDGELVLGWKPHDGGVSAHGVEIRVNVRQLRAVNASGGSQVDAQAVTGDAFSVTLSGASQFTGTGSVDSLTIDLGGAARFQAAGLTSRAVVARLSGASSAVLRVTDSLRANVNGASILEFLGNPAVDATVSDSSIVRRLGP